MQKVCRKARPWRGHTGPDRYFGRSESVSCQELAKEPNLSGGESMSALYPGVVSESGSFQSQRERLVQRGEDGSCSDRGPSVSQRLLGRR